MRIRWLLVAVLTLLQIGLQPAKGATLPPRTVADVTAMLESRKPDPAVTTRLKEILAEKEPANASRDALIEFHQRRAQAASGLGLVSRVLEEQRQLVALTEKQKNQPKHLIDLTLTEMTAGNWAEADRLARKAAASPTGWWGQDILVMMLLGRMQSWLGDVSAARTRTDTIEANFRLAAGQPLAYQFADLVGAMLAWSKGVTQLADGKSDLGEASLVTAARLARADTKGAAKRLRSIEWAPEPEFSWQLLDLIEAQLARVHAQRGNLVAAEQVARTMLMRNLDRVGRDAPASAVALSVLGEVLIAQQRWREAASLADIAATSLERAGAQVNSGYAFQAEKVRIDSRVGVSDWSGATRLIDGVRARIGDEGAMLRATERSPAWALALVRQGRPEQAVGWLKRQLTEQERVFGKDRYETAETRGMLAVALAAQSRYDEAIAAFTLAIPILTEPTRTGESGGQTGLAYINRRAIVESWIGVLHHLQGSKALTSKGIDAVASSFQLGDALRGGSLQSAFAASAARAMAGTSQLGLLIRSEQDLKLELVTVNDQLMALALTPDSEVREKAVVSLRARLQALDAERSALFRQIESKFPDYANLISPRPAGIDQVVKALAPHQALVSILPTYDKTFVWAVGSDGRLAFHAADVAADELSKRVAILRGALDPGDMDFARLRRFDHATSYGLYRDLLKPVETVWGAANELVVVSSGALGQLPLSVLQTRPTEGLAPTPVPFEEMKQIAWLARRVAISNAPSANAFVRLHALPAGAAGRAAFAGFGDPQFGALSSPGLTRAVYLRSTALERVAPGTELARTELAWPDYGLLNPLPDTRQEILSIAKVLGADAKSDVFLGAQASRRMVKQTDLSKRKVIAFATHGLVAGDLPGLNQPALALAADPDPAASPLLTLEDVLRLKLDADWVVLSACNTAAADGEGAEAVSGLGRGFFYAGSRALLVTHWPVETVSARILVTEVFERYAKDPAAKRAMTLHQAMLSLLDGPGSVNAAGQVEFSYAHPIFWAPYALYGDGAR